MNSETFDSILAVFPNILNAPCLTLKEVNQEQLDIAISTFKMDFDESENEGDSFFEDSTDNSFENDF